MIDACKPTHSSIIGFGLAHVACGATGTHVYDSDSNV
jgi:hypothetical protein